MYIMHTCAVETTTMPQTLSKRSTGVNVFPKRKKQKNSKIKRQRALSRTSLL